MTMLRLAIAEGSFEILQSDSQRRTVIRISLDLVPIAGIAFLWFIGVVREQLAEIEDRLFSTVFLGSGLLFLAMMFIGAVTTSNLVEMLAGPAKNVDVFAFGRSSIQTLISVYAMRMAAVFTLSVSTVGLCTSAMQRWIFYLGCAVALVLLIAQGDSNWTPVLFPSWVLLLSIVILSPARRGDPSKHGLRCRVGEDTSAAACLPEDPPEAAEWILSLRRERGCHGRPASST